MLARVVTVSRFGRKGLAVTGWLMEGELMVDWQTGKVESRNPEGAASRTAGTGRAPAG